MRFSLNLLAAHGTECPYCDTVMRVSPGKRASKKHDFPTRDHVIPKSKVPGSIVVIVCYRCNQDKDDLTLDEWAQDLASKGDRRAVRIRELAKKHPVRSLVLAEG